LNFHFVLVAAMCISLALALVECMWFAYAKGMVGFRMTEYV